MESIPEAPKTTVVETVKTESTSSKPPNAESQMLGVSIRGWIASLLIITVCLMSFLGKEVTEPLRSAAILALGFYYGQSKSK